MITETTRRCDRCPELLSADDKVCPSCGHRPAPLVAEWPQGAKRFLCMLIVVDAVVTRIHLTEQQQLEWLLQSAMRGRRLNGANVPYSASPAECYEKFAELFQRWQEAGAPNDFAAIARLRASR